MPTAYLWALLMTLWGLANVFFGYRLFRLFLAISGAFFGAQLAERFFPGASPLVHLVLIVLFGLITSILAYTLYSFTFALLGALLGATLALALLRFFLPLAPFGLIVVVVGILLGLAFGSVLKDLVITLATSAGGASLTLEGLHLLGVIKLTGYNSLAWLILFVIGFISQSSRHSA